ncbi:hypothetical protein C7974DRAFT_214194 [Boeremia exigua]|uniref:uncharacterized protein n=1 Tax=Boeremia exigua TaxID=749465 RepID=UPI001E8EE34D|nr:uncharacterized protein C7974DRAFT_214194 [Boeremia exigua]KAH6621972.1 hypothetical protein C7974DRAFT_214194 [Boeremia exigua]
MESETLPSPDDPCDRSGCSADSSSDSGIDQDGISEDSDFNPYRKPPLPYRVGFKFTANSHEAPLPSGVFDGINPPPKTKDWHLLSQTEYCLTDTVSTGNTRDSLSKELEITSIIRIGSDRGAQLVVVNGNMVAKIYDPLYYSDTDGRFKQDVLMAASGDYSRETAAYLHLQKSPAARKVIPTFWGSWTTVIATPIGALDQRETHHRTVRMILIEHLDGDCMYYVDPSEIRKRVRSRILEQALHAEAVICDAGVNHRDLHPRNIILLGPLYDSTEPTVKIIDFNVAEVMELVGKAKRPKKLKKLWPTQICSPIIRNYGSMGNFSAYGWCPDDEKEAEQWLWRHFKDDKQYYPVTWDPEPPFRRPRYQEDCVVGSVKN